MDCFQAVIQKQSAGAGWFLLRIHRLGILPRARPDVNSVDLNAGSQPVLPRTLRIKHFCARIS